MGLILITPLDKVRGDYGMCRRPRDHGMRRRPRDHGSEAVEPIHAVCISYIYLITETQFR